MPNAALDALIQRYKQELLQYQSRSTAIPVSPPFTEHPSAPSSMPEPSAPAQPAVPSPDSMSVPDPLPPDPERPHASPSGPEPSAPAPSAVPSPDSMSVPDPLPPDPERPHASPSGPGPSSGPAQTPIPFPVPECRDSYTDSGKLRISVYTARQALPIPDADVTVFCLYDQTERLHYFLKTDQSGNTPTVSLPAPPAVLSESPSNLLPYAVYGVRVHAAGYIPSEIRNVQVFSGITGTVSFDLIPASGPSLPISPAGRE